jgi:rhodopsin domain-containing protein
MGASMSSTPVTYPVNDTTIPEPERTYLEKLADNAAKQDFSQDLRGHVQHLSVAFTVFAAVFVALRFLTRYRTSARIGTDDWLIILSMAVLVGNMVMNFMLVRQGLGLHSGALTLAELQRLDQVGIFPDP